MNQNQKPERSVEVLLAKDVSAYARATVTVPAGVDAEAFLRANIDAIAGDVIFRPEWDTSEGMTVVDIDSDHDDDVGDFDVFPRPTSIAPFAQDVVRRHWRRLAAVLPPEVLKEFRSILPGEDLPSSEVRVQPPERLVRGTVEDVRKDVENGLLYLRTVVEEPVLLQYGADVKIEVRPDNESDRVMVYHSSLGEAVIDYDQRRIPALQLSVYRGGHTIEPVQSLGLSRAALEAENAGLKAGPIEA